MWILLAGLICMNIVACFHAYKFTHFVDSSVEKTQNPDKLSGLAKIKALVFGVNNPRPENKILPSGAYQTVKLPGNMQTECWYFNKKEAGNDSIKGTVVLFHGYAGSKSTMLDKGAIFDSLGYNTLLVDFAGSGGSEGKVTTIGFKEAVQVKYAIDYLKEQKEENIYLFGTSMGAVAVLKAFDSYDIDPRAIILECPFGTMYETVCARFRNMNAPIFPMAGLLVFWGGIQNGFWAFGHNPVDYALKVNCPVLYLYGEGDKTVSHDETNRIFKNLSGEKELKTYPSAGHENYLLKYRQEWTKDVQDFLASH